MISVLLPSRKRYELCAKTISGLREKTVFSDSYEVLIAADYDDDTPYEQFEKVYSYVKVFRYERKGYARLHEYYNDLALKTKGDWLFVWNDDCHMLAYKWDAIIHSFNGQFLALAPIPLRMKRRKLIHPKRLKTLFPIVPRKWMEVVGRLSGHSATDTWIEYVAEEVGRYKRIDIDIIQKRPDDEVSLHDAIPISFHSRIMEIERSKDVAKLKEYLSKENIK